MDLNEAYVLAARDSLTLSGFPSSAKKNPPNSNLNLMPN